MSPIPSSPAEWDALQPNETDSDLVTAYHFSEVCNRNFLAAASRLLERERADAEHVERLAEWLFDNNELGEPGSSFAEARRILGVAS